MANLFNILMELRREEEEGIRFFESKP